MRLIFQIRRLAIVLGMLGATSVGPQPAGADPSPHEGTACDPCHQPDKGDAHRTGREVANQCSLCHDQADIAQGSFHRRAGDRCLECHSFHNPTQVTLLMENTSVVFASDQGLGHCQSCHDPRGDLGSLSPGHMAAADLYHGAADKLSGVSPSTACLRCHDQKSQSSWRLAAGKDLIALNTHASHPIGIKVIPGKGDSTNWITHQIDERLPLFDGVMECQTCHLLTADNDDFMVPFETKYELCRGCHKHAGDDDGAENNSLVVTSNP